MTSTPLDALPESRESPREPPGESAREARADYEVLRPARDTHDAAAAPPDAPPEAASPHDPLAERREALHERYRWALTADEALLHRRLLNAGRVAEARALVDQAERFFLMARRTLPRMNEDELLAFEQAVDQDDGPRRYRVVASALRRLAREAAA